MERSWWIRALGNHQPYRPHQRQTWIWHLRPDLSARPLPAHHSPPRLHLRSPRQGQPWAGQAAARRRRQREGEGGHPRRELPASKLQPRPEPPWQSRPGRGGGCPHPKRQTPRLAPPHRPRRGAPPPCREPLRRASASAPGCRRHSTGREQDRPGGPVTPEQPGRHGHRRRTADRSLQTRPPLPRGGKWDHGGAPRVASVFQGSYDCTSRRTAAKGREQLRQSAPGQSGSGALAAKRRQTPSRAQSGVFGPQRQSTLRRRTPASVRGSPAACPGEGGLRSPPRATVTGLGQHQHDCSKISPTPSALSNCGSGNCWGQVLGEKRRGQRKTGTLFLLDHVRALHGSLSPR